MASPASFANFKRKEDAALDCHRLQDCKKKRNREESVCNKATNEGKIWKNSS